VHSELGVLPYLLNDLIPYAVLMGSGYLALRFVRAIERWSRRPEQLETLRGRVSVLEDGLETLGAQLGESKEAQRFVMELLLEKSATSFASLKPAERAKDHARLT
jgi:hypothetical protein